MSPDSGSGSAPLPQLTIADLVEHARELAAQRGWAEKSAQARALFLASEVGEVAEAVVKLGWASSPEDAAARRAELAAEIYDVLWNAVDLARIADVDLDAAAVAKRAHNTRRRWDGETAADN